MGRGGTARLAVRSHKPLVADGCRLSEVERIAGDPQAGSIE